MKYEINYRYAIIIINYHTFYISKVINPKNKIIKIIYLNLNLIYQNMKINMNFNILVFILK